MKQKLQKYVLVLMGFIFKKQRHISIILISFYYIHKILKHGKDKRNTNTYLYSLNITRIFT